MDYFVSAENCAYYQWQLELLIESFKHHHLEDRLVIMLAESKKKGFPASFLPNLSSHRRIFHHSNLGSLRGCADLNYFYALFLAVQDGFVMQPFAVIEPDMLLYQPVANLQAPITFQLDPFCSLSETVSHGCPSAHTHAIRFALEKWQDAEAEPWFPVGKVLIFDQIPVQLVQQTMLYMERLVLEQLEQNLPIWEKTKQVAWSLGFFDCAGISFDGRQDLEMNMMAHLMNHHFINYEHGLPPFFSKYMFLYEDDFAMSEFVPAEAIAYRTPNTTTRYIRTLAESYLGRTIETPDFY